MGAGGWITPGKALAHPFITMSHLIDCTSTAASECVCVSLSLIRLLPLHKGLQIREGAVNDMLMICWFVDWQSCLLAVSVPASVCQFKSSMVDVNIINSDSKANWNDQSPHVFWSRLTRLQRENPQLVHLSLTALCNVHTLMVSRFKPILTFVCCIMWASWSLLRLKLWLRAIQINLDQASSVKWLHLTDSGSKKTWASFVLIWGKTTKFNCSTNLMKQRMLTA